jgi:hypothetical protein
MMDLYSNVLAVNFWLTFAGYDLNKEPSYESMAAV